MVPLAHNTWVGDLNMCITNHSFNDADSVGVAIRGHIVSVNGDPFYGSQGSLLTDIEDGLVVIKDGLVCHVGPYHVLAKTLDAKMPITHYPGGIVSPGFIDTHVHYVQIPVLASYGERLIDWLNLYAFPAEARFCDSNYATLVSQMFFDELVRNGTTSALAFCAVYPESVDAFFSEALRRNMRVLGGKVLMDRNAPMDLLDTAQSAYDMSKELIHKWHDKGRLGYAITPRFAPTSTQQQLEMAAALHREHPDTLIQTHIAENEAEVAWVRELFPDRAGYLDVYDHSGLIGSRTVLAHAIHLTEAERRRCSEADVALSHCPTSNSFLGSGLFRLRGVKEDKYRIRVGLGSDVGGGTRFSMLETMGEAYKVGGLTGYPINAIRLFYLATLGGAQALGIEDKVGSIEVGKEADLVILDTHSTPLLDFRSRDADTIAEQLFLLAIMGDDRAILATYVAGELAYCRDNANALLGSADGVGASGRQLPPR